MSADLKAKLTQLKELHDLGLLTAEAYQQQQQALLATAMGTTPTPTPPASLLSGATTVGDPPAAEDPLAGDTVIRPAAELPTQLGNYRVLDLIGAGGMGTVVRARHVEEGWAKRQGGDVAIKIIHPRISAEPDFRERFFNEADLGKRVQHPGLAKVYDVVSDGPWLGTILEYVEGRELSDWIQPGGLPLDEALPLLTPLAEALDHLRSQGIVHRDLKPANVKVRPDGRVVLLDLGIAKELSGEGGGQTKTMTTMGTTNWMAPEQADAKSVTPAADVYAFGLLAYALLSGRMPWAEGESEFRVVSNKMMGKLTPLSQVAPQLSSAVCDAVMQALAVNPSHRPPLCVAVLTAQAPAEPVEEEVEEDVVFEPMDEEEVVFEPMAEEEVLFEPTEKEAVAPARPPPTKPAPPVGNPFALPMVDRLKLAPSQSPVDPLDGAPEVSNNRRRMGLLVLLLIVLVGGFFAAFDKCDFKTGECGVHVGLREAF